MKARIMEHNGRIVMSRMGEQVELASPIPQALPASNRSLHRRCSHRMSSVSIRATSQLKQQCNEPSLRLKAIKLLITTMVVWSAALGLLQTHSCQKTVREEDAYPISRVSTMLTQCRRPTRSTTTCDRMVRLAMDSTVHRASLTISTRRHRPMAIHQTSTAEMTLIKKSR